MNLRKNLFILRPLIKSQDESNFLNKLILLLKIVTSINAIYMIATSPSNYWPFVFYGCVPVFFFTLIVNSSYVRNLPGNRSKPYILVTAILLIATGKFPLEEASERARVSKKVSHLTMQNFWLVFFALFSWAPGVHDHKMIWPSHTFELILSINLILFAIQLLLIVFRRFLFGTYLTKLTTDTTMEVEKFNDEKYDENYDQFFKKE